LKKGNVSQEPFDLLENTRPHYLGFPTVITMRLRRGTEERGSGYRDKKTRIYVQMYL
jgi:hypothetical protein